ncbi:YhbY family RNA-binding protein [Acidihalobacter prosperus]
MAIDSHQKSKFKAQAHKLKPVVIIGQKGLHSTLMEEIENALSHHELIKLKIPGRSEEISSTVKKISDSTGAEFIQRIGGTVILYRKKPVDHT